MSGGGSPSDPSDAASGRSSGPTRRPAEPTAADARAARLHRRRPTPGGRVGDQVQPRRAPKPAARRRVICRREELIAPNPSPVMRAAAPLLLLLGRLAWRSCARRSRS